MVPSAQIVVDFRAGPEALAASSIAPPVNLMAKVFGTPAPSNARVSGIATGHFTSSEQIQTVALITRGGPLAGQGNAKPSMLVVLENDNIVAQFVPPDVTYHGIAATFDANNDALHDVVLSAQSYQMGQTIIRADILSVAGGQRKAVKSLGTVYENTCDVPLGDKYVRATVVQQDANGVFQREERIARCGSDGRAPGIDAFSVESTVPW
ncbi:MAG: hypothetical protein AB8G17_05100 [Gammaproteobacteria bacterium]